jgi:hypothetical protein
MVFHPGPALAQFLLMGLDLRERTADVGPSALPCRGGCRDRPVRQPSDALASMRCASARSTEPIETSV